MKLSLFQDHRVGSRRNNEDRAGYSVANGEVLLVLADGMGGHGHGEVAAQAAVDTLLAQFKDARPEGETSADFLRRGFMAAHRAIAREAERLKVFDSPRTTCVACHITRGGAVWAHSGDSRLYFVHKGAVSHVTNDHTKVRLLVEAGIIKEEDALDHPERNLVYNCLGGDDDPQIDVSERQPVVAGDGVLLCSDGLWAAISDEEIAAALGARPLEPALRALLDQAVERNGAGCDNTTLLALVANPD